MAFQPRADDMDVWWLADQIVAARIESLSQAPILFDAGNENNRCGLVIPQFPNRTAYLDSAHARHFHVEQERIDVPARGNRDCFFTRRSLYGVVTRGCEYFA